LGFFFKALRFEANSVFSSFFSYLLELVESLVEGAFLGGLITQARADKGNRGW
jgi:hypothetical protein